MRTTFVFIFLLFLLLLSCTHKSETRVDLVDKNVSLEKGFHLLNASYGFGLSGFYIDENHSIYFEAKGNKEDPDQEPAFDKDTPTYPIDARYQSTYCSDSFMIVAGGSGLMNSNWSYVDPNKIGFCDGNYRLEEFRLTWKIADELEKLNLSSEVKWEKRTLIELARSTKEADLHLK